MTAIINDELILNRNESAELIRNMVFPDRETIRRRGAFLNYLDDIIIYESDEGIIADTVINWKKQTPVE